MLIEGINPVTEALNSEQTVDKLICQKGNFSDRINRVIAIARAKGIKIIFEDKKQLDDNSPTRKHQGVMAFVTDFKYSQLEDIINISANKQKPAFIVLLDGIEDPHNLGAIIRSAECAGADGVVIQKHRSATVTDTVVKISAGAVSHIPIAKVTNLNDAIRTLKEHGIWVFAADANGQSVYKTDLKCSLALIIGSEGKGVSTLSSKLADAIVCLPQLGKVNSLNASVAAGILLYEVVRQRLL